MTWHFVTAIGHGGARRDRADTHATGLYSRSNPEEIGSNGWVRPSVAQRKELLLFFFSSSFFFFLFVFLVYPSRPLCFTTMLCSMYVYEVPFCCAFYGLRRRAPGSDRGLY
jgi:hypothetical protein